MRRILATLTLCLLAAAALAQDGWQTSYDQALRASHETSRPILAYFTGSDWCPWCKKLDREVLDTPEFRNWASQYVVLLAVDFPRRTPQFIELKRQNKQLKEHFKITGFPTVLVLTSDGEPIAKQGYQPGGADHWVRDLRAKVNSWLVRRGR